MALKHCTALLLRSPRMMSCAASHSVSSLDVDGLRKSALCGCCFQTFKDLCPQRLFSFHTAVKCLVWGCSQSAMMLPSAVRVEITLVCPCKQIGCSRQIGELMSFRLPCTLQGRTHTIAENESQCIGTSLQGSSSIMCNLAFTTEQG